MANNNLMDGMMVPHISQLSDIQNPTDSGIGLENAPMGQLYVDPNTGYLFSPNVFQHDMNQHHPRIPVTPNMLYAYAHMQSKNVIMSDPMHSTLYIHPNRVFCTRRIQLELVSKRHSIQELPKSALLFWDPIEEAEDQLTQQPLLVHQHEDPVKETTNAEDIPESPPGPPTVGRNHYKGKMVWANFGYILINNKWVDPDSEGEVAAALKNVDFDPSKEPDPPHFERPIHDPGPKIMRPEEEDKFYKEYVQDVTDEQDGEGDPRQYRISPATFARWAQGATPREHYHEKRCEPGEKLPPPDLAYEEYIIPKPHPEIQFDMETGSVLSGIYETDPDPRVLRNPQGVNVTRPPATYTYSYPQSSIQIDRRAFGTQEMIDQARYPAIASIPEIYNSENGIHALAPHDRVAGEKIYDNTKEYIQNLRAEYELQGRSLFQTADNARTSAETRVNIAKEVFFMQHHVSERENAERENAERENAEQIPQLDGPASSIPTPPSPNISQPQPVSPSGFTPPPPQRKLRRQYRRYLEEELDRAETAVAKTKQFQNRLDDEHQEILNEIEDLKVLKDKLLATLGIQHPDEIPGMIPKREKSHRDLRSQFGLSHVEEMNGGGNGSPYSGL